MPSSITFSPATATNKTTNRSIYSPPQKKQKMSITQTYFLAHSARGKLSREAARPDHDLRLLVGHANMLDSLMVDLANAEQEQERWFNKTVSGAHETVVEEPEADWKAEDAENADDESEDEAENVPSNANVTAVEVSGEEEREEERDDGGDEEDGDLALIRTSSRHSPPELSTDSDSDSDDEHLPPSPPQPMMDGLTEKQRQAIATTSFYDAQDANSLSPAESETFEEEGFYVPSRQQPTIIAAF